MPQHPTWIIAVLLTVCDNLTAALQERDPELQAVYVAEARALLSGRGDIIAWQQAAGLYPDHPSGEDAR